MLSKSRRLLRIRPRRLKVETLETRRVLTKAIQSGFTDWGDLPDNGIGNGQNDYSTLGVDHGASHWATGPRLGALRDPEQNGQPTIGADGDDIYYASTPIDDEDGITFGASMIRDATYDTTGSLYVDLQNADSTSNMLDAWIDFNKDGDFDDTGEQIFDTESLGTTDAKILLNFTIPAGSASGSLYYGRFRISTDGGLQPKYFFYNGEVEDHAIPIEQTGGDVDIDLSMLDSDEVTLSTSSGDLVIKSDGETLMQAPLSSVDAINVTGENNVNETVTIDVTGGVPVPDSGLDIDLGSHWLYSDEVIILGTLDSSLDPTYTFTNDTDGTIKYYDNTTLEHTITLQDVETVGDVSSGTGVTATLDQGTAAQDLYTVAGITIDGKTTTKVNDNNGKLPNLYVGEKNFAIVTDSAIDAIAIFNTAGIDTFTIETGDSNDLISIIGVDVNTDLVVDSGDRNDLITVGIEFGDPNFNSGGDLDDIAGSVTIDTSSNTVGYVDVINIRDMDATSGHTYEVSSSTFTRASVNIDVTLEGLERIDLRTGDYADTVKVTDTDDLTSFYLQTGDGNDIVSVLAVDSMTDAEIYTGARNDLVFLGVAYNESHNSSGSLSSIDGELLIDMGSNLVGYVDAINIRDIDETTGHDYGFTTGNFTRDSDVDVDLTNVERVDLRTGSGDDTIDTAIAFGSFYADGGNGNDTLTGGSGNDSLNGGNGNDVITGNGGDDEIYLGNGNDTAYGNAGNDLFYAFDEGYVDTIFGGDDTDEIVGTIDSLDTLSDIEIDSRT